MSDPKQAAPRALVRLLNMAMEHAYEHNVALSRQQLAILQEHCDDGLVLRTLLDRRECYERDLQIDPDDR